MGLTVKDTGGGDFELAPSGTFIGRCYAVVDLGIQETGFGEKHKVRISWELPEELMSDGRPFSVSKTYTLSLNEKANLRHDLESWRGKSFSEDELKGFELFNLLGVPAMLSIVHKTSENTQRTYPVVNAVTRPPRNYECPPAVNEPLTFSLEDYTDEAFKALPDWLQQKINTEGVQPEASETQTWLAQYGQQTLGGAGVEEFEEPDDSIPFIHRGGLF